MEERKDLLQKVYLSRVEIQRLFQVSRRAGERLFKKALEIDDEELNFRPYINRVRMKSVLKIQKISFNELERQIKSAPSLGGQSTTAE